MNTLGVLYEVKEVARILGVHQSTVYLWIYEQQLEAYNFNGLIRISDIHLEEFIHERRMMVDEMDYENFNRFIRETIQNDIKDKKLYNNPI
ncbi:hypothetical protein Q75_01720 [Bacillus coahuilensis p1.1.43]|uniref:Helix-turn-helix domain-containing protein n=1 Tax=Bacillus coahuilensis p1.1.43 TaxID=1150625 RepID=A0A147KBW4_9BACI|nr:helix-turn-helix domain-containing protein [Bacillus coahuilensis]KUP08956.1 hypothetical protein Q75_01720 [Bacillus coahuilensis p1.1.43]